MRISSQIEQVVSSTEQFQIVVYKVLEAHKYDVMNGEHQRPTVLQALNEAVFVVNEHQWHSSVYSTRISLVDSLIALRQRINVNEQKELAKSEVGSLIADLQMIQVVA
jgi:hypothetical protein